MTESAASSNTPTERRTPDYTYVIVTGGRDYPSDEVVERAMIDIIKRFGDVVFINGGAKGADTYCSVFALKYKWPFYCYPAQWERYRKSAGSKRNALMLDMHPRTSLVLAFHSFLPNSRGTYDMCEQALKAGIPVMHYDDNGFFQAMYSLDDLPEQKDAK